MTIHLAMDTQASFCVSAIALQFILDERRCDNKKLEQRSTVLSKEKVLVYCFSLMLPLFCAMVRLGLLIASQK